MTLKNLPILCTLGLHVENLYLFLDGGINFSASYKSLEKLQILLAYSFCILHHFATKLGNF